MTNFEALVPIEIVFSNGKTFTRKQGDTQFVPNVPDMEAVWVVMDSWTEADVEQEACRMWRTDEVRRQDD